jgi:glycosyltransferase involved in cell wall biosynthesis
VYLRILKNLSFYLQKERRKLISLFIDRKYKRIDVIPKFSAYLSIYNDADILSRSLDSIREYVDELIVVDGAYTWNASYLKAIGLDPEVSEQHIYEILEQSKIPYKVIKGVWSSEVEKRIAGYEATSSRYVMRIDADEVILFNDDALNNFFASQCAVAEMYMPNYVAPGLVIGGKSLLDKYRIFPRQACLFDKEKISAINHLQYLWLVLTADELPHSRNRKKVFPVFEKPVAFCAHLTNWRFVESSILRSSFYNMNWMRKYGAPWVKSIKSSGSFNFDEFFAKIDPKNFFQVMRNSLITQGDIELRTNQVLTQSPISIDDEKRFIDIYHQFLFSLEKQSLLLVHDGGIALKNYPFFIDLTSQPFQDKIIRDGKIQLQFAEQIDEVEVQLKVLQTIEPFGSSDDLAYELDGDTLIIYLKDKIHRQTTLRKSIKVIPKSVKNNKAWVAFRILSV